MPMGLSAALTEPQAAWRDGTINLPMTLSSPPATGGGNGQEQGIGEDQVGTGGTEQVTDDDWQNAVTQMNAALSGKGWQYELKDGNSLPTLKRQ